MYADASVNRKLARFGVLGSDGLGFRADGHPAVENPTPPCRWMSPTLERELWLPSEIWRYCPPTKWGDPQMKWLRFGEKIELTTLIRTTYGNLAESEVGKGIVCASRRYTYMDRASSNLSYKMVRVTFRPLPHFVFC